MVIRFQLHKFSIVFGLLICLFSLISVPAINSLETIQESGDLTNILIIDAGHGGSDGGAIGIDGTTESKINLDIAIKLNLLGKLCGVSTIMTRESENIDYPPQASSIAERKAADQNARLRLIQDNPYGILFSIHQNSYPSERISGIQVLYGHDESSLRLGNLLQDQFNRHISSNSRRVASEISNDIYLLKHCGCPSVLIECGFISNREECKLLQTQEYQKKLTVVMLGTYMEYANL